MTLHLSDLWDFSQPAVSEERFRAALPSASPADALILHTQIARTYGLRGDFAAAQRILAAVEPQIAAAGLEAQAYYYLELGRTYASAAHSPESQTPQALEQARSAYLQAADLAREAHLDALAIDALHMLTFVDTDPTAQIAWNRNAIDLMLSSDQPAAKKWEGSLRNNLGYALHQAGRYDDALAEFHLALAYHQQGADPGRIRVAHWMIAWTLRAMRRLDEALAIQLRLEKECAEAGEPDPYVFEELEQLYTALDQPEKADHYAALR